MIYNSLRDAFYMGKLKPRSVPFNIAIKLENRYLNPGPLLANIFLSPKDHIVFAKKAVSNNI